MATMIPERLERDPRSEARKERTRRLLAQIVEENDEALDILAKA
jgi:hypothetical protein